jgi:hypothetical protein
LDSPAGLAEQPDNVIPIRPPEPEPVEPEPPLTLPWWRRKAPIAIAACVVTAGLLYLWVAPQIELIWTLNELRQLTVVPLTAFPGGRVWSPTFSPDGNQIAFVWYNDDFANRTDLYAKVIGNDTPLRLTHGASGVYTVRPVWLPDGKNIALCRLAEAPSDSGIFQIISAGGTGAQDQFFNLRREFGPRPELVCGWKAARLSSPS